MVNMKDVKLVTYSIELIEEKNSLYNVIRDLPVNFSIRGNINQMYNLLQTVRLHTGITDIQGITYSDSDVIDVMCKFNDDNKFTHIKIEDYFIIKEEFRGFNFKVKYGI